jgi:hypothetical protein
MNTEKINSKHTRDNIMKKKNEGKKLKKILYLFYLFTYYLFLFILFKLSVYYFDFCLLQQKTNKDKKQQTKQSELVFDLELIGND